MNLIKATPIYLALMASASASSEILYYGELRTGYDQAPVEMGSYTGIKHTYRPSDTIAIVTQVEAIVNVVRALDSKRDTSPRALTGETFAGLLANKGSQKFFTRVGSINNVFLDSPTYGKVNPWVYTASPYSMYEDLLRESMRIDYEIVNNTPNEVGSAFEPSIKSTLHVSKTVVSGSISSVQGPLAATLAAYRSRKDNGVLIPLADEKHTVLRAETAYNGGFWRGGVGLQRTTTPDRTSKDVFATVGLRINPYLSPMVSYSRGTGYKETTFGVEYKPMANIKIQGAYIRSAASHNRFTAGLSVMW